MRIALSDNTIELTAHFILIFSDIHPENAVAKTALDVRLQPLSQWAVDFLATPHLLKEPSCPRAGWRRSPPALPARVLWLFL